MPSASDESMVLSSGESLGAALAPGPVTSVFSLARPAGRVLSLRSNPNSKCASPATVSNLYCSRRWKTRSASALLMPASPAARAMAVSYTSAESALEGAMCLL